MIVPNSCCSKEQAVVPLFACNVVLKAAECEGYIERMAMRITWLEKVGSHITLNQDVKQQDNKIQAMMSFWSGVVQEEVCQLIMS
jgi:hypothetical protein